MHLFMSSLCHCNSLRVATRRLSASYDEALAPFGINIAQFSLLRAVERRGKVSLTALGRVQELDRSTIGRNVRVLERMGLVEMGRSEDDQREAVVQLTPPGAELVRQALPSWEERQHWLEARIGGERLRLLREILQTM